MKSALKKIYSRFSTDDLLNLSSDDEEEEADRDSRKRKTPLTTAAAAASDDKWREDRQSWSDDAASVRGLLVVSSEDEELVVEPSVAVTRAKARAKAAAGKGAREQGRKSRHSLTCYLNKLSFSTSTRNLVRAFRSVLLPFPSPFQFSVASRSQRFFVCSGARFVRRAAVSERGLR